MCLLRNWCRNWVKEWWRELGEDWIGCGWGILVLCPGLGGGRVSRMYGLGKREGGEMGGLRLKMVCARGKGMGGGYEVGRVL